jgi:hypothetical protein
MAGLDTTGVEGAYRAAAIASGAAILVAMLTFQFYSQTFPIGGSDAHLEKREMGFFCWIASMGVGSIREFVPSRRVPSAAENSV